MSKLSSHKAVVHDTHKENVRDEIALQDVVLL